MKAIQNPIIPTDESGRTWDPQVVFYNGWYYHCYQKKEDGVFLARTRDISDLANAEELNVFCSGEGELSNWYAPELHRIDGVWYIYGAPLYNGNHCMCVLKNENDDPFSNFEFVGGVEGLGSDYNLDGTIAEFCGKRWFIWSGGNDIFISELLTPTRVNEVVSRLISPEFEFEMRHNIICEGPAFIEKNGKAHIVYSVNDSIGDDYCLGRITFSGKGDFVNPKNWVKHPEAVFEKTDSVFGPGHCSFCKDSEDNDYMIYHANLVSGSGWTGRSVWAQRVEWDENDCPVLGKPYK